MTLNLLIFYVFISNQPIFQSIDMFCTLKMPFDNYHFPELISCLLDFFMLHFFLVGGSNKGPAFRTWNQIFFLQNFHETEKKWFFPKKNSKFRKPNNSETRENEKFGKFCLSQGLSSNLFFNYTQFVRKLCNLGHGGLLCLTRGISEDNFWQ